MKKLPNDPVMLLSVINTGLRDTYPSMDELCAAFDVKKEVIDGKLALIDYVYDPEQNRYV